MSTLTGLFPAINFLMLMFVAWTIFSTITRTSEQMRKALTDRIAILEMELRECSRTVAELRSLLARKRDERPEEVTDYGPA